MSRRHIALLAGVSLLFVSLLVLSVWYFPAVVVDHDRGGRILNPAELVKARNAVRSTLLQGLGAAFFLVTAVFTWQQVRNGQHQLEVNRAQLRASEENQVIERFSRAVDQLGDGENVDTSIGAIYTLEGVARDPRGDHDAVIQVLAAYLRIHAPWASDGPPNPLGGGQRAEIQAALTVLGRRDLTREKDGGTSLDLTWTDLRSSDLRGSRFPRSRFNHAHLERAHLRDADLREARFREANLKGARFIGAHLQGAILDTAAFDSATSFEGAYYDDKTRWPRGFTPDEAGAIRHA